MASRALTFSVKCHTQCVCGYTGQKFIYTMNKILCFKLKYLQAKGHLLDANFIRFSQRKKKTVSIVVSPSAPVCILCYVCLTAHDSCRALAWSNLESPASTVAPLCAPQKMSVHCGSEMTRTTRVTPFLGCGPAFFAFNCPKRNETKHTWVHLYEGPPNES